MSTNPTAAPTSVPAPVASFRHTIVLVAVFLAAAIGGAVIQRGAAHAGGMPQPSRPAALYLSLLVMEWALVLYVWRAGLRPKGIALDRLIGGRWKSARDVAIDIGLGLATWGAWELLGRGWDRWLGPDRAASVGSLLPRTPLEVALWICLSLSAGFCEELVFRGYFQTQFHALTGRRWLAVALQALLFGVSHGYQGVRACLQISAYAVLLGVLALARMSLRPGMVTHAWTDIAGGIFRI
jgi:membrane protease YdiL (CAAX protease family)